MKYLVRPVVGVVLAFGFIACQQNTNPIISPNAVGTLEIVFDTQTQSATALVRSRGIQTQAVRTNAQVSFTAQPTLGVTSDVTNNVQYISAKFNVNNLMPSTNLTDVTLIAYQKAGNIGSTALRNVYNFAGSNTFATNDATGIAFAQSVKPVNPPITTPFAVDNLNSDLQLFTENELTALQTAANTANEISTASSEYLFPYGYVARNSTTSRTLTQNTNSAGTVNVAIRVPTSNSSLSTTAYRFSMTFVIFDAPVTTRVSESLEEQAASGADTRGNASGFNTNQIAAVVGSSLLQTNDKLVNACRVRTAGTSASPTAFLFSTALTTTAGSFDQCFAAAGKRQINANEAGNSTANGSEKIIAMAIQPDGKIVLAGWTAFAATGADFLVMRLNPDGSFDRSFDTDGKQTIAVVGGGANDEAHAVVIQPDGKIVLGGCTTCNSTGSNFAMARVNANGSLDTGFATAGIFTANTTLNNSDDIYGLALQTVSSVAYVVAAGVSVDPTATPQNQQGVVFRLAVSNGALDTTVGTSGYRFFSFQGTSATPIVGTATDNVNGVVVDASNRIIVGGNDDAFNAGVVRFTTTGAFDIKATTNITGGVINGVLLLGTSAIVYGAGTNGGNNDFLAIKFDLTTTGTLDTTWGNQSPLNGRSYVTLTANSDSARAAAFQTDGKIILAGRLRTAGGPSSGDAALIRLNSNGTLDTGFGTSGIVTVQRQSSNVDEAYATAVNAGKIIVAGFERLNANNPIQDDMFVLQFNP